MIRFQVAEGFERVAFAEVLIPNTLNVYGDFHTKESIRQFAYGFMINGFGIDLQHDNVDVSEKVRIVESFVARDGDPTFVPGAWVVGIHVLDDDIWNDILSGELNGFSYEAVVSVLPVEINVPDVQEAAGETYPDPTDGHTHQFYVRLDGDGRVISGGTTAERGHSHSISSHTFTDYDSAQTHRHRFSVYTEIGGEDDEAA
jgi:hypothetical protein